MCLNIYRTRGYSDEDFFKCLNSVYVQRRVNFGLWGLNGLYVGFVENHVLPENRFTEYHWEHNIPR